MANLTHLSVITIAQGTVHTSNGVYICLARPQPLLD